MNIRKNKHGDNIRSGTFIAPVIQNFLRGSRNMGEGISVIEVIVNFSRIDLTGSSKTDTISRSAIQSLTKLSKPYFYQLTRTKRSVVDAKL